MVREQEQEQVAPRQPVRPLEPEPPLRMFRQEDRANQAVVKSPWPAATAANPRTSAKTGVPTVDSLSKKRTSQDMTITQITSTE